MDDVSHCIKWGCPSFAELVEADIEKCYSCSRRMCTTISELQYQTVQPINRLFSPSYNDHLLRQVNGHCSIVCLTRPLASGRFNEM